MAWTELPGSPTEEYAVGSINITREFQGEWDTRYDFANELILYPYANTNYYVQKITIKPASPECPLLDETDRISNINQYTKARMTATYGLAELGAGNSQGRRNREPNGDDTYFTCQSDSALELYTLKGRGLKWIDGVTPVSPDFSATIQIPVTNYNLEWKRVYSPNWTLIDSLSGMINKTAFRIPVKNITCAPGTLLFAGYNDNVEFLYDDFTDPQIYFSVGMSFIHKRIPNQESSGWNYFYRDTPGFEGWVKLVDKQSNKPQYEEGEFNFLFRQG